MCLLLLLQFRFHLQLLPVSLLLLPLFQFHRSSILLVLLATIACLVMTNVVFCDTDNIYNSWS